MVFGWLINRARVCSSLTVSRCFCQGDGSSFIFANPDKPGGDLYIELYDDSSTPDNEELADRLWTLSERLVAPSAGEQPA